MSNSSSLNKEKILAALSSVVPTNSQHNVVEAGRISGVTVMGERVGFLLAGDASDEALRQQCEAAIRVQTDATHITAVLTAHSDQPQPPAQAPRPQAAWNHQPIEGVGKLIAIASGKGGVGKSSIATLLALAAAKQGRRTGLLDADIYGPSIPTMLGIAEQAEVQSGQLIPQTAHGIQAMSMGMLIGDQAAVMRAPRVTKALQQMLRQTRWNSLDTLFIDMPPGTGDVHLSMVQQAHIGGAIIVTLASKVAALDAKKSIEMFEKVNVPILGIIENMSSIAGSSAPFGSGGGEQLAKDTGHPLLAKLPLEPQIGEMLNRGKNPFEAAQKSELLEKIAYLLASL